MRQILLFAALAASLALLSGCTLSKTKKDTEDMTGKAAYHKLSAASRSSCTALVSGISS